MAKLPSPDPQQVSGVAAALTELDRDLWRIHSPVGAHPTRWDQLRSFGSLTSARFDPWLPPPGPRESDPATTGVGYFGLDVPTCLAEVFQSRRTIDRGGGAQLSAFGPRRRLRLIDLRGTWPISIGASHLINSGPKDRCRAWTHAIRDEHPGADGLLYTGMAGRDCVVIYAPPGDVFPERPAFSRPLADPALAPFLADAAQQIGYDLRPLDI